MLSVKKSERNSTTWLHNYKGNSLAQYRRAIDLWTQYLGDKNEQWVLDNKLEEDWATHLVNFHRWLKKRPKEKGFGTLSDASARVYTNGIRGYLKHIGIGVSFATVQKAEISKIESSPTLDFPFNLRTKEKLLSIASPLEEYIVSAGVSFGLRIGDFLEIKRATLETIMDRETPIQLPKMITKKIGVPAYPFIDRDAKSAIERLLRENPKGKMLNLTQRQTNTIFKELFERAGINTEGYRVRFHILRKFLTDNLSSVCSGDKWKHFVGKSSKSPYVTSEGKIAYTKVMEFTCVNGDRLHGSSASQKRIEELERAIIQLQKDTSTYKTINEEMMQSHLRQNEHTRNLVTLLKQIPFPEDIKKIIEKLEKEAKKH